MGRSSVRKIVKTKEIQWNRAGRKGCIRVSLQNKIMKKNSLTHFGHLHSRSSANAAFLRKGTPLCTSYSGSLTVETALTLPVFICALVLFIFLFHVQQIQLQMELALHTTAGHLAQYACLETEDDGKTDTLQTVVEFSAAEVFLRTQMDRQGMQADKILGGKTGVSLLGSDLSGEDIHLKASYQVKVPVAIFGIHGLPMQQTVCLRKWTGKRDAADKGDWVYITPTGKVFHESSECPYLDLSIQSIALAEIAVRRNKSGGRYSACSRCGNTQQTIVYITDYGDAYHGDLECSGLKRTVYRIRRADASDRRSCKKCGKGEG